MRIAIVSHFAPPQPAVASHRVLRLSRLLIAAGHRVHWVTLDTAQLPKRDDTLARVIPEEVVVHGLGGPTLYSQPAAPTLLTKVFRSLAYDLPKKLPLFDGHFEWTWRLKKHLPRLVAEHDLDAVLICCSPHGQIAAVPGLRRAHPDLRIFVDYRDLLSGNPWNDRGSERLRAKLQERERRALAFADTLFLNTEEARDRFTSVFGPIGGLDIDVMRNTADYRLGDEICAEMTPPSLGPGAHIGFFGTLFPQRRLREVLLAMQALEPAQLENVTLHCFCDDRQSPPLLEEDLAEVGRAVASRARRHAFLPYAEALSAMRAMHALALVNSPDERDSVFVPGKLYDYLMSRRPVLFIGSPGDASTIVTDCGGRAFAYGDHAALAATIGELTAGDPISTEPNSRYAPESSFAPLLDRLSE